VYLTAQRGSDKFTYRGKWHMKMTLKGLSLLLVVTASAALYADTRQAIPVPAPDSLVMALTGLAALAGAWRWKKSGL